MSGTFEIYKDKKGEYRFRLKAKNGEVIAVGEGYTTKQNCLKGVESVRKAATGATILDMDIESKKNDKEEKPSKSKKKAAKKKG